MSTRPHPESARIIREARQAAGPFALNFMARRT